MKATRNNKAANNYIPFYKESRRRLIRFGFGKFKRLETINPEEGC